MLNRKRRRSLRFEPLEQRRLLAGDVVSWHNSELPFDVDRDNHVAPIDALLVINALNEVGSGPLSELASDLSWDADGAPLALDVDGDGYLAPIDGAQLINRLNGPAESEATCVTGPMTETGIEDQRVNVGFSICDEFENVVVSVTVEHGFINLLGRFGVNIQNVFGPQIVFQSDRDVANQLLSDGNLQVFPSDNFHGPNEVTVEVTEQCQSGDVDCFMSGSHTTVIDFQSRQDAPFMLSPFQQLGVIPGLPVDVSRDIFLFNVDGTSSTSMTFSAIPLNTNATFEVFGPGVTQVNEMEWMGTLDALDAATMTVNVPSSESDVEFRLILQDNDSNLSGDTTLPFTVFTDRTYVANFDERQTIEEFPAEFNALLNDIATGGLSRLLEVDGTPVSESPITTFGGEVTVNGDLITFQPDPHFNGFAFFSLTVGNGIETQMNDVDIFVEPVNFAPFINGPPADVVTDLGVPLVLGDLIDIGDGDNDPFVPVRLNVSCSQVCDFSGIVNDGVIQSFPDPLSMSIFGPLENVQTATDEVSLSLPSGSPANRTQVVTEIFDVGETAFLQAVNDFELALAALPDPPTNFLGGASIKSDAELNGSEDQNLPITVLSVTGSGELTVQLSVEHGSLQPGSGTAQVMISADGDEVSIAGDADEVNQTLNGLVYTPSPDFSGTDQLTITTSDPVSQADTDTVMLTVAPVNDPPVNRLLNSDDFNPLLLELEVLEDSDGKLFTGLNVAGLSVADIDAGDGELTVVLRVDQGSLTVDEASSGNGTPELTIQGTLPQLNQALQTLQYAPPANFTGPVRFNMETTDNGHTPAPARFDGDSFEFDVTPVNDPPQITHPDALEPSATNTVVPITGLSVSDIDAGDGEVTVELVLQRPASETGPIEAISFLSVPENEGVVISKSRDIVQVTGQIEAVNDALRLVIFSRRNLPAEERGPGIYRVQLRVNDNGHTGQPGPLQDSGEFEITFFERSTNATLQAFVDRDGDGIRDEGESPAVGLEIDVIDEDGGRTTHRLDFDGLTDLELDTGQPSSGPGPSFDLPADVDPFFDGLDDITIDGSGGNDMVTVPLVPKSPAVDTDAVFALSGDPIRINNKISFFYSETTDETLLAVPEGEWIGVADPVFTPSEDGNSGVISVLDPATQERHSVTVSTEEGTLVRDQPVGPEAVIYRVILDPQTLLD